MQMHLLPDGDVRACCRNAIPLGNITEQRLPEIWFGARRSEMEQLLSTATTPTGCENCAAEVTAEGRRGSYPEVFDFWADELDWERSANRWPTRLEFNLSNRCNLQCLQCSGDLSSAIRIHREHRPPLPAVYDEQFFDDLAAFLPHLHHANFAGGEPFLGPENFRVWEMIAELSPQLPCTINTNATRWNDEIRRVLERGRFSFIFSLDGIHKATYESIRVGSDLDVVLSNIERFRAYAARRGTDVNINHCLMPQNHHEFGDLLLYAESRGIKVNVSVVRTPRDCSIAYLPQDEIRTIHRTLAGQSHALLPRLRLNASTWLDEVRRIGTWAEHGPPPDPDSPDPQQVHIRGRTATLATLPTLETLPTIATVPTRETLPSRPSSSVEDPQTILGLSRRGTGPTDDTAVRAELQRFSADGTLHTITVGYAEKVIDFSPGLLMLLCITPEQIDGQPVAVLQSLAARRFGTPRHHDERVIDPNRIDSVSTYDEFEVRSAMIALRGNDGWAETAAILIAVRPR